KKLKTFWLAGHSLPTGLMKQAVGKGASCPVSPTCSLKARSCLLQAPPATQGLLPGLTGSDGELLQGAGCALVASRPWGGPDSLPLRGVQGHSSYGVPERKSL
ncbi:hypothetical protein H1C71_014765, partial [Ictidomys tridecemlineatus]